MNNLHVYVIKPIFVYLFSFIAHKWIFAKLEIKEVAVVDMFGGRKFPSVSDYFTKNCTKYLYNYTESFNVVEIDNE